MCYPCTTPHLHRGSSGSLWTRGCVVTTPALPRQEWFRKSDNRVLTEDYFPIHTGEETEADRHRVEIETESRQRQDTESRQTEVQRGQRQREWTESRETQSRDRDTESRNRE